MVIPSELTMDAAILLILPLMFLMLCLGYLVMSRVMDRFASVRFSGANAKAVMLAERYMVQAALAKTRLARRNRQLTVLTEKLDLSGQELARLNDMKSKFLSMVVHDVRSPLATIRGFSELLARKMPGEREKTHFGLIIGATDQLNRLISDLTDLAMIEAGKLNMETAPMDLRLIADDMLPGIRVRAAEKNVVVNYYAPDCMIKVNGDRFRLGQVLMNLLTNAMKFTPAGGKIDLTIAAEGGRAGVYVKDSGIGLHPSEVKKIFEKFYQAKYQKDAKLRKQGWGLGLCIATEIIRAHKGEIAAVSQGLGKGSTFYYKLPLLVQEPARG